MSSSAAIYPSLRDKVVLITGGAEGIGAAAVELFCQQGSKVAFLDRSKTSAISLVERMEKLRTADEASRTTVPTFYFCNVADLEQLSATAQRVLSEQGHVDLLVNNAAATGASSHGPSSEITPLSWAAGINVNLRHVFFLTQAIVPTMQKQGSGSIINMGSISWRIPAVGGPVYIACKAAIMGLTNDAFERIRQGRDPGEQHYA